MNRRMDTTWTLWTVNLLLVFATIWTDQAAAEAHRKLRRSEANPNLSPVGGSPDLDEDYIDPPFTVLTYYIHLTPYLTQPEANFSGNVIIHFRCRYAANVIELHSKRLAIVSYWLEEKTDASTDFIRPIPILHLVGLPQEERIRFRIAKYLEPGKRYSLVIDYDGSFNRDGPTIGVFTVQYKAPSAVNLTHHMMATTLRPNHARALFPCIDVPDHRATFRIVVTRDANMMVLSNTDRSETVTCGSRTTDVFQLTEHLAPFQLVVVVFPAEDWTVSSRIALDSVSSHLWMPVNEAVNGREALKYVGRDVGFLEQYTGLPMPFKKMDFFALKDYHTTAFEHPGLITLKTSVVRKPQHDAFDHTAKTLTHELGHQWFGNLVTVSTWADLWFAEGLTCLVAFKALHNHHEHFAEYSAEYHVSQLLLMRDDLYDTARPLYQRFSGRPSWRDVYQPLIWTKGHAVARVLEHFVGEQAFRDALRAVLRDNRWATVSVWRFLEYLESTSDQFRAASAWPWFQNTGYPLITVNKSHDVLFIRSYSLDPRGVKIKWPLSVSDLRPFCGLMALNYEVKYENGDLNQGKITFKGTERGIKLVLMSDSIDYFMLNTDGFYTRILYDNTLQNKLIVNINSDDLSKHEKGRLSLLEDANMLYQYGLLDSEVFSELSNKYCHRNKDQNTGSVRFMACWRLWSL